VTLSANFRDLINQQEALEAQRTRVLLLIESGAGGKIEDKLLLLQMILASQVTIAKELLVECASVTCEGIDWPHDIRA
jgi:hypothetical protein